MHKKLLLVLVIGGLIVAFAFGAWLFGEYGRAQKASRLSVLMILRKQVVSYARSNGKYPGHLADVVSDEILLASIKPCTIAYVAAANPYPLAGDKRLFYERKAQRYGFEIGWFEFEEYDWSFHRGERQSGPQRLVPTENPIRERRTGPFE